MNEFTKNILHPPKEFSIGQIWYADEAKREFLIVGDSEKEIGMFKAILISRVTELSDGTDVFLKREKFKFLASDRLALRYTLGPIHRKQLSFYLGSIDPVKMEEIKKSIKKINGANNYDEDQQLVLAEILDELESLRQNAIELYEKSASVSPAIFKLPVRDNAKDEDSKPYRITALAASDSGSTKDKYNFWQAEEKSEKYQMLINNEKIFVKFSEINEHLYLIIYVSEKTSVSKVGIVQDGKTIYSEPKKIEIPAEDRTALYFDKDKISKSFAELRFILNGVQYSFNLSFE